VHVVPLMKGGRLRAAGGTSRVCAELNERGLALMAWVALYVVTPVLVPAIYLANRSRARPAADGGALPHGIRLLLGAPGAAVLVDGLLAFVQPAAVISAWPCPLTPLTLRILAAVFALYGTVGITVALHPDAAGCRIPIEWDHALAPVFVAGIATRLAIGGAARVVASRIRCGR
jgi:hypothetical protein